MKTKDEDIGLILKFKEGDKDAFRRILEKYKESVINIAYRLLRDREEAEDIAQEVFIRVYRAAKVYRHRAKFSTYLYRITTNLCLNELRKAKRKVFVSLDAPIETVAGETTELDHQIPDTASPTPVDILSQKEMKAVVQKAIDSLPPNQRMAIILSEYEGLSYQEIAQTLSCSVKAVERRLYRARENLKQSLSPRYSTKSV